MVHYNVNSLQAILHSHNSSLELSQTYWEVTPAQTQYSLKRSRPRLPRERFGVPLEGLGVSACTDLSLQPGP